MGLGDISGIFSRFFVVGFYLPSFFTLVLLNAILKEPFDEDERILVIGGAALLLALLLSGFRDSIWFKFSGYFRHEHKHRIGGPRPLEAPGDGDRREWDWKTKLRWNRFRDATEDYRRYVRVRWGLDTWIAWPFIEASLSEREREIHTDARATVHFFQNACLGALVVAVGLVVAAIDDPVLGRIASVALAGASLVAAYLLYRGAVGAVRGWGESKIVSAVAHRHELYASLGYRMPVTQAEEHEIGRHASELLYGDRTAVEDRLRARGAAPDG
jgi:hypothetical protein